MSPDETVPDYNAEITRNIYIHILDVCLIGLPFYVTTDWAWSAG